MGKRIKSYLKKYNTKDAILIVASYPERRAGTKNQTAVSWYIQRRLKSLSKLSQKKFIILAQKNSKNPKEEGATIENEKILVIRCWKRDNPLSYLTIFKYIKQFSCTKTVLFELEFALFGNLKTTALFPLLLLAAKLLGKSVVLELHQVVLNLATLSGHLGLQPERLICKILNLLIKIFYSLICKLADKIIVLEEELKTRTAQFTDSHKIKTIPISVYLQNKPAPQYARKVLGLKENKFTVSYFGFITWYKGIDWAIKQLANQNDIQFLIAGGESHTLKNKPHYQRFYAYVRQLASKASNVKITGFVPDKDIPLIFAASHLVILPYRTFMSASGPLTLALEFRTPFLLSEHLRDYIKTMSFRQAIQEASINKEEIFFPLDNHTLLKQINKAKNNPGYLKKLKHFTACLAKARNYKQLDKKYLQQLLYVYNHSHILADIWGKLRPKPLVYRVG